MKMKIIAIATVLALSSTCAIAQSSVGSGSSATNNSMNNRATGRPSGDATIQKNMGTVGNSKGPDASQQGANTAAPVGARGDLTEPGKVQEGKTR